MPNPFAQSPEGAALGETCRAYGKWPHELGDLPPAERTFVVAEMAERLEERAENEREREKEIGKIS